MGIGMTVFRVIKDVLKPEKISLDPGEKSQEERDREREYRERAEEEKRRMRRHHG